MLAAAVKAQQIAAVSPASWRAGAGSSCQSAANRSCLSCKLAGGCSGSSCQSAANRSCLSCKLAGGCWQQLSKCSKAQLSLLQVGGRVLAAAVKAQQIAAVSLASWRAGDVSSCQSAANRSCLSRTSWRAGAGSNCQSAANCSCLSCKLAGGCWQQLSKCSKAQLSLLQVGGRVLAAAVKAQEIAAVSPASWRAGAGSSCQSVAKRSCLSCKLAGGCWQQLSKRSKSQLSLLQVGGRVLAAAVKAQQIAAVALASWRAGAGSCCQSVANRSCLSCNAARGCWQQLSKRSKLQPSLLQVGGRTLAAAVALQRLRRATAAARFKFLERHWSCSHTFLHASCSTSSAQTSTLLFVPHIQ